MDEVPQDVDGEELDLPLNQEPGTAAPGDWNELRE